VPVGVPLARAALCRGRRSQAEPPGRACSLTVTPLHGLAGGGGESLRPARGPAAAGGRAAEPGSAGVPVSLPVSANLRVCVTLAPG
jgi:hypothetical protein